MGKGKKPSGKTYVSKGERRSSVGTPNRDSGLKMLNKMSALRRGKDVVFTIANPNKAETNKPFIRVKASGRDYVRNGGYKDMTRAKNGVTS